MIAVIVQNNITLGLVGTPTVSGQNQTFNASFVAAQLMKSIQVRKLPMLDCIQLCNSLSIYKFEREKYTSLINQITIGVREHILQNEHFRERLEIEPYRTRRIC